ncbi:MAG TPA: PfkB family carbohydrate kinase, partial [Burkholderiales bacterium]|nr:PfkB family carbohydrate kinase [Burkholderiales bacterium]
MSDARAAPPLNIPDTARARVLIVGDVMLDRYWFGDASRVSPEAPVPVVLVEREEARPGGAANVARNCVALGATAQLLSVVADDEHGRR